MTRSVKSLSSGRKAPLLPRDEGCYSATASFPETVRHPLWSSPVPA
jgi:hypothetical protein